MKRVMLMMIMVSIAILSTAQTKRKYFCEVKGIEKEITAGLKIVFDFGKNPVYSAWEGLNSKLRLVDENGKEIPFNSMVDAGNYMSDKGWTFVQAYTSFYESHAIVHWIFSKESESPEKAVEGIMTKEEYKKRNK